MGNKNGLEGAARKLNSSNNCICKTSCYLFNRHYQKQIRGSRRLSDKNTSFFRIVLLIRFSFSYLGTVIAQQIILNPFLKKQVKAKRNER
jgi:hypothetical protein